MNFGIMKAPKNPPSSNENTMQSFAAVCIDPFKGSLRMIMEPAITPKNIEGSNADPDAIAATSVDAPNFRIRNLGNEEPRPAPITVVTVTPSTAKM